MCSITCGILLQRIFFVVIFAMFKVNVSIQNYRIMRRFLFSVLLFFGAISAFAQYPAGSPVALNGKLKVSGTQMVNKCGKPIQLRGMSTHGPQWFSSCYCSESLDVMVNDWGISLFRLAMYVSRQENGFVTNKDHWRNWIDQYVDMCGERGIYCLIDWHVLNPGNPNNDIDASKEFWDYMSKKHGAKDHVLFEICNEPNGVDWSVVKSYAETIIPIIRKNDPNTIIIVGTPTWSQDVDKASQNKLSGDNIMYTLHFYAGSHKEYLRQKAQTALNNGIALFVTEFGTSHASGDKDYSPEETKTWIKWLNERKISWACWSYADKNEVSSSLISGSCKDRKWNNTSESGTLIKNLLKEDLIEFEACDGSSDAGQGDGNQNEDNGNDDNNQSGDGSNDNNQGNVDDDEEVSGNISYPELAELVASGNVYRIVNKKSGKVITTEGDMLVQKPRDEKDSRQLFKATVDGDFVLFSSAEQENMTNKYNPNDNAEILLQAASSYDDPSEKWSVTKVAENVWFRIQNKSTNNTTSCIEANKESGDRVRQASWKSDDAQMWGFELVAVQDGGTYIDPHENDGWAIIPTLVDDKFTVIGGGFDEVAIVSVSGVVQKEFGVSNSYDMAGLQSGMYFIYLKNSGAVVKRFSVLKK